MLHLVSKRSRWAGYLSPILVGGTVLSLASAALFYAVDPNKNTSLLAGLVTFTMTLVLEAIARITALHKSIDRTLELFRVFATRPPWLFNLTEESIRATDRTLSIYDHDFFHEAARSHLQSCRDSLDDLSRGYMKVSADDKRLSLRAIQGARNRIRAVSITHTDLPTWFTPSGQRYLAANEAAIGRGVAIERVFVYDAISPELTKLINQLTQMHCTVFKIRVDQIPADKRIDMVIFDELFAIETRTNAEGAFVENVLSANPADIQRRIVDFEFIKGLAE